MRFLIYAVAMVVILTAYGSAHAQSMRPGMWQMSRSSADPSANARVEEMRKRLDSLPPGERERVESMMAASGQSLGAKPGEMVSKVCITPQEAAKLESALPSGQGCTRQSIERNANTVHFKTKCPGSTSDAVMTFHGDTAFDGKLTMLLEHEPGPRTLLMSGKWLSATCDKSAM